MSEEKERYDPAAAETKWRGAWEKDGLYRASFRPDRADNFVVDTPPPTVSGSLHIGHIFSYTHQDLIVRYQRMRGHGIFYPMGWDDNGLPTERRVQNHFNVRCDPKLPHDPNLEAAPGAKELKVVSRRNFIELCKTVTAEDELAFKSLWQRIGLSVDWSEEYATIDERCRRTAQWSFLDLHRKGHVYSVESPTLWDVTFRTAVAQAEVEDRVIDGAYYTLRFGVTGQGTPLRIATTRPELLGACVAICVHPEDDRHKTLIGKTAITPGYRIEVPIRGSDKVDREKGTGAVMVCTFGDLTDIEWWRELKLPLRSLINRQGKISDMYDLEFETQNRFSSVEFHKPLIDKTVVQAREEIVRRLGDPQAASLQDNIAPLEGVPKPVRHPVKFYEKGNKPLEILSTRQWFVRILDKKKQLIEQGRKIQWHPDFMRKRYENWVEGLNLDWCISRQRYFGVPIPVWYPLADNALARFDEPMFPAPVDPLPVDPLSTPPPNYHLNQCDLAGGYIGEPDVFDTWFTSSLTPQIATGWHVDEKRHRSLFPMDVRPSSHEIIRTWAFYTIVKAHLHDHSIPWKNVVISGWILDPDRKKMSKSKGNVVTPADLIDKHSADAVRYWAARARLGTDTALDEKVMANGSRLATKLFNAFRFVRDRIRDNVVSDSVGTEIKTPLDLLLAARLASTVERATREFDAFEYAGALAATEQFFWSDFCDNYIELVKHRLYEGTDAPARASALATLRLALSVQLRLFAPFVPFVAEELWRQLPTQGSIHAAAWPAPSDWAGLNLPASTEAFDLLVETLTRVRKEKTARARNKAAPIQAVRVELAPEKLPLLQPLVGDLAGFSGARVELAAEPGLAAPRVTVS